MIFATADLCDAHEDQVRVANPIFRHYGGRIAFCGPIATLKLFEDNGLVRQTLDTPGAGRGLGIDGGGSLRCALLGDQLAELAV
ncbi:MAG: ribonuclease, partial [Diaphorobacter sp.]|nr:ribonuclease [Diaphorobacter sp.]